jgi:hypothetical protein
LGKGDEMSDTPVTVIVPTVSPPPTDVNLAALAQLGFNMQMPELSKVWRKQKFVMLGEPKTGKTRFWASAGHKAYFIRTEPGHTHVQTLGEDCRTLGDIQAVRSRLMRAKTTGVLPFDTIVIDTGDRMIDCIHENVLEMGREKFPKNQIEAIGDIPEGIGWFWASTKLKQLLKQFEELDCAIVIICHIAQDEREDELTKKKYKKDTIAIGGKTGKAISGWADHILHVRSAYVGDILARQMVTRGSKLVEAGSRLKEMAPVIQWVDDDAKNFTSFRNLFV